MNVAPKKLVINGYKCFNCQDNFSDISCYDTHIKVCASNKTLLLLIEQLSGRVEQLEKDRDNWKRILRLCDNKPVSSKKMEIIELLNTMPPPTLGFNDWISNMISSVEHHLEVVFSNDLLTGMNAVFKDSVVESIPIVAFDKKPNVFYYYDEKSPGWTLLENGDFDQIVSRLGYRFLVEFNRCWYQPNVKKIQESEEYSNLYNRYYINILGGNRISDESRCQRIRQAFYNLIKRTT